MLILKVFKLMANLFKFLKRMLPLRLIFWLLHALQDRPGRHFESTPACVLGISPPWWWLRSRGFVSDKLRNLAELRPERRPRSGGRWSLPAGGGSLVLAREFPSAPA
jgi:hypothetical protein